MNDFQSYLDQNLQNIHMVKEDEAEYTPDYDIYAEIREMLRNAREEAGMTQRQLAERTGLTQANISNMENGSSRPTIDSLKKIADAFGKKLVVAFDEWEELM